MLLWTSGIFQTIVFGVSYGMSKKSVAIIINKVEKKAKIFVEKKDENLCGKTSNVASVFEEFFYPNN